MKLIRYLHFSRVPTNITIAFLAIAISGHCWRLYPKKCKRRTAVIYAVPPLVSVEAMKVASSTNMLRRFRHRPTTLGGVAFLSNARHFGGKSKQSVFLGLPRISPLMRPNHQDPILAHSFMISTPLLSDPTQQTPLDFLPNEEKSIYNELLLLSERIRMLDAAYYGENDGEIDGSCTSTCEISEVSDDEYDALARREAEICTKYPHLLAILEHATGLGTKATRFGGRVGQVYLENNQPNGDSAQLQQESKPAKRSTKRTVKKRIKRQHLPNALMQSLDNAMDEVEAVAWINRVRKLLVSAPADDLVEFPVTIIAEPKIDGLSLSLRYVLQTSAASKHQFVYKFVWAATRGDGSQGEDVTEAVQAAWMKNGSIVEDKDYSVPDIITINSGSKNQTTTSSIPSVIEIRGEVVLPQESFEHFSREVSYTMNLTSFSNARNAASGILLRSKDPKSHEELERTRWLQSRLRFYAYDIVTSGSAEIEDALFDRLICSNMDEMRNVLTGFGFDVPNPVVSETVSFSSATELNHSNMSNLLDYHHKLMLSRDASASQSSSSSLPKGPNATRQNQESPYQIDGVVYKLSDFRHRKTCGSSSRTPRWAIAHKFPPMSAVTHLLDIDVQVGRTGALTPVAILEPVDLGGVLVSRASLHNFHFARKVLLPETDTSSNYQVKLGISVLVSRAGDVIPQVMKRIFDDAAEDKIDGLKDTVEVKCISLEPPSHCPACGSPTSFEFMSSRSQQRNVEKKKTAEQSLDCESNPVTNVIDELNNDRVESIGKADEHNHVASSSVGKDTGQVLRCTGPQLLCQPRAVNALVHAYSRAGLDVKGLSRSRLQQLLEENVIRFPADLFLAFGNNTKDHPSVRLDILDKIAALPGWGVVSSENLADSVQLVASTGVSLARFIYSLGIPFIGSHASQLIASSYKNVNAFLNVLDEASNFDESNLIDNAPHPFVMLIGDAASDKVKGIGPVALSSLLAFSKEEVLMKAAKDLAQALQVHEEPAIQIADFNAADSFFKDMSVVFTGTLPMSRTAAQNAVKARGAKSTPNTVSKSTTLVVVGEKGGKKAKQANEMGIQVMRAEEFMKLIGP
ncbi:hypothetical protein HJC23_005827 [Cyclotella cryptica]|uniref:DNA ligase (NAD(+)) n=1 Tax=Cyclotella cryptica TaxID=29204 RepID=A0ABD3QZA5_9STRA|eukprot:CCRYP_000326-RA/>CCRYP_000326-RA protein AED:0.01 eAED:0.01 QI:222/1/1/1/1/1/2/149/1083